MKTRTVFVAIWIAIATVVSPLFIAYYYDDSQVKKVEYVVMDKLQSYSYHKSNATQVNSFKLKKTSTDTVSVRQVDVLTHSTHNVGDKLYFMESTSNAFDTVSTWFCFALLAFCALLLTAVGAQAIAEDFNKSMKGKNK